MQATRNRGLLAQSWLVLALAAVFGVALAAVQVNLSAIVAANKLEETLARIPELVWGPAAAGTMPAGDPPVAISSATLGVDRGGKGSSYPLFRVTRGGDLAGWVVKSQGQGYADRIEVLVGLDPAAETILGLFVLDQKETPGLGNKITEPAWRAQFVGRKTAVPLRVGKGAGPSPDVIDAISGATISSRSVTAIVNRVAGDLRGRLTPAAGPPAERPK